MSDEGRASIEHLDADGQVILPLPAFAERALIPDRETYDAMYRRSVDDPEGFWGDAAREELDWIAPFSKVFSGGF
jgi:acetyl-CoA synthetase